MFVVLYKRWWGGGGGVCGVFFFFKQKTAYEMCGRDWSSDVCSSDLKMRPQRRQWCCNMAASHRNPIGNEPELSHVREIRQQTEKISSCLRIEAWIE